MGNGARAPPATCPYRPIPVSCADMGKPKRCPECGATEVVPIVYGLPGPDLVESAENEEVVLGGCLIGGTQPQWRCVECDHSWPNPNED